MTAANPQQKSRSNVLFAVVAVVLLLVGLSAGYFVGRQSSTPGTGTTVSGLPRPATIPLVQGWVRGNDVAYLDYGPNPNVAAPILAFFEAASPNTPVKGQKNIIDTIPGLPSYSDFWRVYKVLVPAGYVPNSIRSFDEAVASGYQIVPTDIVVNCPVVNPGTTIQNFSTTPVAGWYRDREVFYFDQGTNSPASGFVVQYAPIYAFFWENGTAVAGQRNVIEVSPGEMGYSDLWRVVKVIVNPTYVPNTLKDTLFILAEANEGNVTLESTNILVNCPVVV